MDNGHVSKFAYCSGTKRQNQKMIAMIYHQHVIPTKFHDFSSVTKKLAIVETLFWQLIIIIIIFIQGAHSPWWFLAGHALVAAAVAVR